MVIDTIRGTKFNLPHRFVSYIEFDNTVVFLLDKNNAGDEYTDTEKIVAVKLSQKDEMNQFYIAWEFRIIDGTNFIHNIDGMWRGNFNNEEIVICYSGGFDIQFSLDVETGEIVSKAHIK